MGTVYWDISAVKSNENIQCWILALLYPKEVLKVVG